MYNYDLLKIHAVTCFYYNAYKPNLTLKHNGTLMTKYELDIITAGRAHLTIDNKTYFFYPGDICFRKPGQLNVHNTDTPYECLHIRFRVQNDGCTDDFFRYIPTLIRNEDTEEIRNAVSAYYKYHSHASGYHSIMCDASLTMLKAALYKLVHKVDEEKPVVYNTAMQKAIDFMYTNADMTLNINELADTCGYSPKYFQKLFKETTGMTPYKYLLSFRIEKAKKRLKTTQQPIGLISAECGFLNSNHFSETFRKHTGMTPRQYRKENS